MREDIVEDKTPERLLLIGRKTVLCLTSINLQLLHMEILEVYKELFWFESARQSPFSKFKTSQRGEVLCRWGWSSMKIGGLSVQFQMK